MDREMRARGANRPVEIVGIVVKVAVLKLGAWILPNTLKYTQGPAFFGKSPNQRTLLKIDYANTSVR